MITVLFYILLKKCSNQTAVQIKEIITRRIHFFVATLVFFLLVLIPIISKGQAQQWHYKIVQGGDDIGWLRLEKNITGSRTNLSLVSELRTRVIFRIEVSTKETSIFENGLLLYSSQYRKTNGTVKLNKQISRVADKYVVNNNGEKQYLSIPVVATNLLSLYFHEPISFNNLYCDKYESFIKIVKTDDGGYKVVFPDGNSNTFYYSKGICTKIMISHTFYSAQIIKTS